MPEFASVLDKPSSAIAKPKPLPVGTYICVVNGLPKHDKSPKKQTEFSEYTLNILQPMDDVDEEALAAAGGFAGKSLRATYWLTDDAAWRLKKFLVDDLKIDELVDPDGDPEDEDNQKSLRNMESEAPGRQVLATVRHTASDDGTTVYANLASTAPVE